jgi:hypothetical protein
LQFCVGHKSALFAKHPAAQLTPAPQDAVTLDRSALQQVTSDVFELKVMVCSNNANILMSWLTEGRIHKQDRTDWSGQVTLRFEIPCLGPVSNTQL